MSRIFPKARHRICRGLWCVITMLLFFGYQYSYMAPFPEGPVLPRNETGLSIVFLETSSKSLLTTREACVLESAAYHNPEANITVLSISKLNTTYKHMKTLSALANIHMELLDTDDLFKGTPLEEWHSKGLLKGSKFPTHHLSDASRLAVLWKSGGVYLDTDALIIRPIKGFQNAVPITGNGNVANGVLFFEKFNHFLYMCMEEFTKNYDKNSWDYQGPYLLTRVLKKLCNANTLDDFIDKPDSCYGIRILPQKHFLPLSWQRWKSIVKQTDLSKIDISNSYSVHLYSSLSHNTTVQPKSGVLLDLLAEVNCPQIYRWMVENNVI